MNPPRTSRRGTVLKGLGAAAVLAAVVAAFILLPLRAWTLGLVEWARGAGAPGVAGYAAVYILATVLMLPGSLLTLGAGFAYGPVWGSLLVSPVSIAAAALAFLLGRTVARGWVGRRMDKNPKFSAIDRAVEGNGFKLVLLLRLSPVLPFNLLNYALALTKVRFRDYLAGSALGMLPGTVLYVYLGSLVTSVSELSSGKRPSGGAATTALYVAGLVATVAATVVITRVSRRELKKALDAAPHASVPTATKAVPS